MVHVFCFLIIREIKLDVMSNGKQQKWNFCRLSLALWTVEVKHLYLWWIVGDIFLFLCPLRIRRKEHKFRDHLCHLLSVVNVMLINLEQRLLTIKCHLICTCFVSLIGPTIFSWLKCTYLLVNVDHASVQSVYWYNSGNLLKLCTVTHISILLLCFVLF